MEKQRIINNILQGTASAEELKQFQGWLLDLGDDELLDQYFKQGLQLDNDNFDKWRDDGLLGITLKKIENLSEPDKHQLRNFHRVHFLKTAWFRVAVAVLIILTGVLIYTGFFHASDTGKGMVKGPSLHPNILPGGNKAVLTLSDGRKIELNNDASDIINDDGLLIENNNGQLNYGQAEGATHPTAGAGSDYAQDTRSRQHPSEGGDWRASYNTMSTPRGGQYQLILPDGSKVWLNAESSVTFPTAFTGKTREIKMTGEAYFEIKADKQKPFIVKTSSDEIQVLGTSFNVNAYIDAPVKTSLLQGSVKVQSAILKPGQAFINGKIMTTNLEQDIAWKNGRFDFSDIDAKQVMLQIGRWYNVEVEFNADTETVKFIGSLKRSIPLSNLLKGLEGIGGLHFTTKGKTIIVSRKIK